MYPICNMVVYLLMRILCLCVLIILFDSFRANAQEITKTQITVNGEIRDAADNSPVPFVHIINTSTAQGTASNSEGRFNIRMSATDTLLFSAIGFEKYIFTLSENIDTKRLLVTIVLDASSMELDPVKIFAYKGEQSFKRAIIEMDVPEQKSNRMQLDGFYYGPRKEVKAVTLNNGALTGVISHIQNKLSKRAKQKRQYAKVTAEYDKWIVDKSTKYNPQIVQRVTGLTEDEIEDFMIFCKLENSFISLSSEYEVVVAIQKCLVAYTSEDTVSDTLWDN